MPKPTIKRVSKGGGWVWEVEYCGMARHFADHRDWSARQFFERVGAAYALEASSQASRSAM
tara:strand:+ start:3339 stop:3521 length:183 start_codon:yes stop_codon:yes gene_type:complete